MQLLTSSIATNMDTNKRSLENVYDANSLVNAFKNARSGSDWKESVQRYEMDMLQNTYLLQKAIKNKKYQQKPFVEFELKERGKTRHIKSIHISDRVVQRSLCDNVLTPVLKNTLIYDNGASIKKKGIDFARRRIETHLHKFYRQYKSNEGYILLIDFSKFFDNIPHKQLSDMMRKKIQDEETMQFINQAMETFVIDVSFMSDEEYKNCMNEVFDSIKYAQIDKSMLTGEKLMHKSMGIGAQISQIAGVFYPLKIDNYCKIVKGIKYYARYMDDIYIIDKDKEFLKETLKEIKKIAVEHGLFINDKKTQIIKLSRGFTFLKVKYQLTKTGHVSKRLLPKTFTRERRKLKKYKTLLDEGLMEYKDIENAYKSWKENVSKFHNKQSIKNMDKLFDELFIEPFTKGE